MDPNQTPKIKKIHDAPIVHVHNENMEDAIRRLNKRMERAKSFKILRLRAKYPGKGQRLRAKKRLARWRPVVKRARRVRDFYQC